jgi:hypothetical protein
VPVTLENFWDGRAGPACEPLDLSDPNSDLSCQFNQANFEYRLIYSDADLFDPLTEYVPLGYIACTAPADNPTCPTTTVSLLFTMPNDGARGVQLAFMGPITYVAPVPFVASTPLPPAWILFLTGFIGLLIA